jgi:hypothetical protein
MNTLNFLITATSIGKEALLTFVGMAIFAAVLLFFASVLEHGWPKFRK